MKYYGKILASCALCLTVYAHGDALIIDTNNPLKPLLTGQSMQQIHQQFGEPLQRLESIGTPPIVRWQYETQTLYFEEKTVIHSVQHHQSK